MATAEPITALLQRHLAGEDISGQIADMVGGNPRLASIMSLLADREAQLKSEIDAHPHDEADQWAELRDRDQDSRRQRAEALQAQWQQMSVELERLYTTVDEVACALGACPRCLGADPECVLCRGRSGPGSLRSRRIELQPNCAAGVARTCPLPFAESPPTVNPKTLWKGVPHDHQPQRLRGPTGRRRNRRV